MIFWMTMIALLLTVRSVEGVFNEQFPTQAVVLDLALLSSVIARRRWRRLELLENRLSVSQRELNVQLVVIRHRRLLLFIFRGLLWLGVKLKQNDTTWCVCYESCILDRNQGYVYRYLAVELQTKQSAQLHVHVHVLVDTSTRDVISFGARKKPLKINWDRLVSAHV